MFRIPCTYILKEKYILFIRSCLNLLKPDINNVYEAGLDTFFEINRYCDEIISIANKNAGKRFIYFRFSDY